MLADLNSFIFLSFSYVEVNYQNCTNPEDLPDHRLIDTMKSFPSGHSALGMFIAVYMIVSLNGIQLYLTGIVSSLYSYYFIFRRQPCSYPLPVLGYLIVATIQALAGY